MSGHSKFANIKHKKEKNDAAKGKIFTVIGREIALAVKEGGADPANNSKLRDVIAKAKSNNMPNDTIERGIKKAAGDVNSVNYEQVTYEGYGPSGIAIIVEALTDNKNRTAANVRSAFTKGNGNMGNTGCVSYNFENKGYIVIERTVELDEDTITEFALEAGADDVVVSDDVYEIFTDPDAFSDVRKYLEEKNKELVAAAPQGRRNEVQEDKIVFIQAEVAMIPQNKITLPSDKVETFLKMIDALEENDDVQNVYHNVDLPDEE